MTTRRRLPGTGRAVAAWVLVVMAAGCTGSVEPRRSTLTVFAAASLTDAFERLGARFEATHPGVDVEFSFAGSTDLAAQIQQGAPADVFASADTATMDGLVAEGLLSAEPRVFATNTLRIAVPPDNPAGVRRLADLASPEVDLVVCAPQVPCGAAAVGVAEAAGLSLHPVSEEQSVTDVLNKVAVGEADAGLVYRTDVIGARGRVLGIDFPESRAVVNAYPIAPVADGAQPGPARRFVDLVLGAEGREVLGAAGFGLP